MGSMEGPECYLADAHFWLLDLAKKLKGLPE